jgi:dTDP-4-amino-4,6-dideoxygalactose transaminase
MSTASTIPFFNYPALFARDEQNLLGVMTDVLKRGAYILQKDLFAFEDALKDYLNVRHVFGVADGTNAMIIGLRAAGIGPGDEVIVPSHTYIATAAAVHLAGATPVLADMGPDHMMDPASVEPLVGPKTRAIMPVQVNGRTCDMDALRRIADLHGLLIFEDAAQALGSRFRGQAAGTFGTFGTFSFYPAKLLGCFGDGGAIVTNDDDVARQIALLRDHGRNEDGQVVAWGTNSRLDNLQAAVLLYKLQSYADEIDRRREIARMYTSALGGIADIVLPPGPDADPDHFDVYQNYEIEAGSRDALREHLSENGIGTLIQWSGTPVHQMRALGFTETPPATEAFFRRCFMLPMHTALSDGDVQRICGAIHDFYSKQRKAA